MYMSTIFISACLHTSISTTMSVQPPLNISSCVSPRCPKLKPKENSLPLHSKLFILWAPFYLLTVKVRGFPAPNLNEGFSPGALVPICGQWYLETKTAALGILTIILSYFQLFPWPQSQQWNYWIREDEIFYGSWLNIDKGTTSPFVGSVGIHSIAPLPPDSVSH